MSATEGPLKGVAQWDNVKLIEVWREFVWHCKASSVPNTFHLSEYNKRVRDQLVAELNRRDIYLPSF